MGLGEKSEMERRWRKEVEKKMWWREKSKKNMRRMGEGRRS